MIHLQHASLLWLAIPWLVFWLLFSRLQRKAFAWIEAHVGERFRPALTRWSRASLRNGLLVLLNLGGLLVLASAGPGTIGEADIVSSGGRIVLLIDASASMYASDVEPLHPGEDKPPNRLEVVKRIASNLVADLGGYRFALASFSGVATLHLPTIEDRRLVQQTLGAVEQHNFYQNTGSSFGIALDAALHFLDERSPDLQVVLMSDGEQPFAESFETPLAVLAERGVPVHTVAVGSLEGQDRRIMDFRDIVAGVEEPAVLREYTTRRDDEHLERIAERTGGAFSLASATTARELATAIRRHEAPRAKLRDEAARNDLTWVPLLVFLVLFVFDALVLGRAKTADFRFDLSRLGVAPPRGGPPGSGRSSSAGSPRGDPGSSPRRPHRSSAPARAAVLPFLATLLLFASSCGDSPRQLAHRENEQAIALDRLNRYPAARTHYERSIGFDVEPQIPTYNLARSVTLQEDYSEAHDLYQEALRLEPNLVEAYFNDGVAFFEWGAAERDPDNCELERTLELWSHARGRFAAAATRAAGAGHDLERRARRNLRSTVEGIAAIEELIKNPPEACRGSSQDEESPSAGAATDGASDEDPEDQEPSSAGSPPEDEQQEDQGQEPSDPDQPAPQDPEKGDSEGGSQEEEDPQGEGGGPDEPENQDDSETDPGEDQSSAEPEDQEGDDDGEGDQEQDAGSDTEPGEDEAPAEPDDQERAGGGGGQPGPPPLSDAEFELVEQELERIAQQAGEPGKFFRKTRAEQFPKEEWENPQPVIWW